MMCTVDERRTVRQAAAAIEDHPQAVAVDVLEPTAGTVERWTVEVVLSPDANGVPSPALAAVAEHDLRVRDVSPQHLHWHALVTP